MRACGSRKLGQIQTLKDVVSPGLWGAFVLLAGLPWLAKIGLSYLKKRRIYARWAGQKPRKFDRNLIVIGAGAAGLVTAYIGAAVKAKVTLIEAHKMGGDCLNYGCIPSKALIKTAKLMQQINHAKQYGIDAAQVSQFSFKTALQRIEAIIALIAPHDSIDRYTGLGVEVLQGHGQIIDPWRVKIRLNDGSSRTLSSRSIVIAAGAKPVVPPLAGLDQVDYLTSDTLWAAFAKLEQIPRRIVVLGGGPIGCELAQALARLGAQVWQIEAQERLLRREDEAVSALVQAALRQDGVRVLTGHQALRCENQQGVQAIIVQGPAGEQKLEFDALICAVGRTARLEGYGLEDLGIPTNKTIVTDAYLATLYPNIFAAGDVAGPYQFTHVAAHQAWYAAVNALFGWVKKFKVDYALIPAATFVDPEVARVGLNQQEARQKNIPFEVTQYALDDLDRAIADSETKGFVQVLTVPGKDKILGVTIVGSHAADLLAEYVLAMKHGLGLKKILGTIHIYPTLSEANKYAAGAWAKAHAPKRLLQLAAKIHAWRLG